MRIALVVAILLLLCEVGICVESQPPPPSALKSGAQQDKNGDHPNKAANELKQTPTSSIVEPVPPTNPETQIPKYNKEDKSPSEWWLIGLTAILALATYRLVVQTRRLVTETATASKRQAAETQTALNISKQAADAAQKSAEVAEKTLTLGKRPYVFAFNVSKFCIPENLIPAITYEVANFGKTPAIIQRVQAALENIESSLDTPNEVDSLVSAPILSAGEVRKGIENETPANMINFKTIDNAIIPDLKYGEELFFRVIIYYRGPFTEGHESSFCWRYNTHTNYFEPYGHEDYNYTK